MLNLCMTGPGYSEAHFSQLISQGFEVTHYAEPLTKQDLQRITTTFDAYVLGGDERLTADVLSEGCKLQMVSFVGTGYTSFIDEAAAKSRNIVIKNTPAIMAPAVAEHTIGLLLGVQRKLFHQNWEVKNACITPSRTEELSSMRVGIVGLGEIGTRVARILHHAFGSQLIYHSRTRKEQIEKELNLEAVSLDQLFSSADVIILSLPTNSETEYFINESLLSQMKNGVVIINTAGARLIEPIALKKYLDNNKIATAAFDGYYIEPLPNLVDDPFHLLSLPDSKFIVTPHTAAKTAQTWCRMLDKAVDNVIQFFNR
jgi:glyoxylate reductase